MPVTIRPLQQSDALQIIALCSAVQPERVRDLKVYLRRLSEPENEAAESLRQWVALKDGTDQCLGYAACWNVVRRKYRLDLMVHPDCRRQRIASALLETILVAARSMSAATLQARTLDDRTDSLQFLHERGFAETHRMIELRLNLGNADFTSQASLQHRLMAQGVEFTTLDREEGAGFWSKLTDLQRAAVNGWPDPDPDGKDTIPTEDEVRRQFASWQATPDSFFLAKCDGLLIGYTQLRPDNDNPEAIVTGPTAVRPEYRGRGVATALKVLALSYAREQGWQIAATNSASPAMIRVNEKLGFRQGRTEVRLVKSLNAARS
jgi:mycothiol synthase